MVDCKVLFPSPKSQRVDVSLPAYPGYVWGWTVEAEGVGEGRLILGIDNRTDGEFGLEAVRVYVDVRIHENIPVRVELYTLDPLVPTFEVAAGEVKTVELESFLAGQGLDFTQCDGIGISLESAGGETKTKAHLFCGVPAGVVWRGEVL